MQAAMQTSMIRGTPASARCMCTLAIDIQPHSQPGFASTRAHLTVPTVHIWARSKYVSPAVVVLKMVSTTLRICRMFSAKTSQNMDFGHS